MPVGYAVAYRTAAARAVAVAIPETAAPELPVVAEVLAGLLAPELVIGGTLLTGLGIIGVEAYRRRRREDSQAASGTTFFPTSPGSPSGAWTEVFRCSGVGEVVRPIAAGDPLTALRTCGVLVGWDSSEVWHPSIVTGPDSQPWWQYATAEVVGVIDPPLVNINWAAFYRAPLADWPEEAPPIGPTAPTWAGAAPALPRPWSPAETSYGPSDLPTLGDDVQLTLSPGAVATVTKPEVRTHPFEPERKVTAKSGGFALISLFNEYTEFEEMVDALYKALDKDSICKARNKGARNLSRGAKMEALADCWGDVAIGAALFNVVASNIEDIVWAKLGVPTKELGLNYGANAPVNVGVGILESKNLSKSINYVEGAVRDVLSQLFDVDLTSQGWSYSSKYKQRLTGKPK